MRYQICSRCVMDTSDPDILFDAEGVCNHCHQHSKALAKHVFSGEDGRTRLAAIADGIRKEGRGKPYDCIIGVSGGVDSTYTAWLVKQLGLRPLAVHLDNGWNSRSSVQNISSALQILNIDLETHVVNWEEYREIQRAFLLASVPDVEIPTDHAIIGLLSRKSRKYNIKTIISGHNNATESHLPAAWSQGHLDFGYIRDVCNENGFTGFSTFPHLSFASYLSHIRSGINALFALNYVDYNREKAVSKATSELGWVDYGGKHHESIFTRWYQGYYLPTKFGFDKRRAHQSSLVCTGQITRDTGLAALQAPPYDEERQQEDCHYVAKKLGFSPAQFEALMAAEPRFFSDFHSYAKVIKNPLFSTLRRVRRSIIDRKSVAEQ